MAKGSKLLTALDRHKGVDHKLERQKKQQKQAEKKRKAKKEVEEGAEVDSNGERVDDGGVRLQNRVAGAKKTNGLANGKVVNGEEAVWETDEDESDNMIDLSRLEEIDDSDSSDDDDDEAEEEEDTEMAVDGAKASSDEDEEDEDIPLSDLDSVASEEKGDIIPHQRMTINNTTALLKAHKSFTIPTSSITFSEHMSVTSSAPTQEKVPDVEDDLNRELQLYAQSLEAVKEARKLLKKEGLPMSRPADYFAEMVKSDEHMGRVKQKLVDEAASKKAASEARRQRDLKKFGKQVQVAKQQERDKAKRDTLDKISLLKRKRQGADGPSNDKEGELFDVALDDEVADAKPQRRDRDRNGSGAGGANKRHKKNEKFGFGGKKRFAKSGDAMSSSDMKGFSVKKMKAGGKPQRPGKARRASKKM